MKVFKLTKGMLKDACALLRKVKAVDETGRHAYPQYVYLSKEDYKTLKMHTRKAIKKQCPYANKQGLDYAVGCELLNLGPNQLYEEAIKPGYVLVDVEAINGKGKAR